MKVIDKTDFMGAPAVEVLVLDPGNKDTYMVESLMYRNDGGEYDDRELTIKAGKLVRMRRPEMGDHMIINVAKTLFDSLNVEDAVNPTTGGLLVKSST